MDRPLREALTWAQTHIDGERHKESITLETVQMLVIRLGRNMHGRSCAGEEHITGNCKRFCHTESITLTALFLCSNVF